MYIGSSPNFGALDSQTITSANGSTATFTLNQYVPDSDSIIVTVGNVVQEPTEAYTASGNSITFTENVPNGDTIVIRYLGRSVDVYTGYKRVQRFKYVATNGQQTFTGADANSRTLEYTAQDIDVFYNGVRLDESEFTATNGSSVILATGATTNAELVILAYKVVQLADVVPASSGGTFTGNVVFSGNATVNGNLTASGTTTLVDTTNTVIKDNLLGLNHGATSNSNDAGIIVERGSTGNDALLIWDESEDKWALGTTTSNASSTGNLNMTTGTLVANLEGTIQTASQTNITSVGTLTGLTVSGDASVGDDLSLNSDGAIINFGVDSDVTLTHVHNAGLKLNDGKILYLGDDQDFQLFHNNSSNLQVIDANNRLLIRSPRIDFQNGDGTETTGVSIADGVFALFHDNTERLSTNSNGINLNSTSVSGNPANAKFIVNSSSQYDGIALGTGASSAVIGRHSNGAGMHFTANSAPANMGGGTKVGFQFSSGTSGGSNPIDIFKIYTNGYFRIGTDNNPRISLGNRTNTGNAYIGKLNDDASIIGNTCAINFGSTSGEDFLDFHSHHSGIVGGKMITLHGDSTWVHSYFQNTTKGGTNAYTMYPAGSGNAPLSVYNKTNTGSTKSHSFQVNGSEVASITYTSSGASFNGGSDYRLKENVTYDWDATSRLKQLKPARFNFKVDKDKTVDGFLAHEVSDIVPNAITGTKDAVHKEDIENQNIKKGDPIYQTIDHSKLVPLLVKSMQEMEARIEVLEKA